jgi:ABC-2 type transport system permease protein
MVFNPAIIVFFVLFLVSGYILYSTIFALIGSIVNSEKEAQSFVMPIAMLIILPIIIGIYVIQEPHSTLAVTLSLIPFLTPTMMMMRVVFLAPSLSTVSLFSGIIGEATLGFILVVITIVGMIWLTAKIFRIGILMYGKRPTLPEIIKWVKY